jgi:hypothetical protein
MNANIFLTEEERQINLGGFPPIFVLTDEFKKKREFNKGIETINKNVLNNLNILNIKNIFGTKK